MMEELNLYDMFTGKDNIGKFEKKIGVSVITPNQNVTVKPGEYSDIEYHNHLLGEVLKEIYRPDYNVNFNDYLYSDQIEDIYNYIIPNGEDNVINIRYVVNEYLYTAIINIPMYINSFQLEELEKINNQIIDLKIDTNVSIKNYNPISASYNQDENSPMFDTDGINNLESAICFLKKYDRIKEYNIPNVEENIFKFKSKCL